MNVFMDPAFKGQSKGKCEKYNNLLHTQVGY